MGRRTSDPDWTDRWHGPNRPGIGENLSGTRPIVDSELLDPKAKAHPPYPGSTSTVARDILSKGRPSDASADTGRPPESLPGRSTMGVALSFALTASCLEPEVVDARRRASIHAARREPAESAVGRRGPD